MILKGHCGHIEYSNSAINFKDVLSINDDGEFIYIDPEDPKFFISLAYDDDYTKSYGSLPMLDKTLIYTIGDYYVITG